MRPRSLELLALLVVALAVWVLLDHPPAGTIVPLPDRIFPGLAAARITEIRIVGPGRPEVALARTGTGWTVGARPADDEAVADLTGTLEYLSFRRRVPAASGRGLDAPRLTIEVTGDDGAARRLRVGAAEPLLGRTWVTLGDGTDLLVDDYAVRALDRRPDDLRRRAPFAGVADTERIVLTAGDRTLVLRGRPPCVEVPGGCAAADRARVTALRDRLADLALARFLVGSPDGPATLRVEAGGAWLEATGAVCPDAPNERQVRSPLGAGCLAAEALAGLAAQAAAPATWIESSALTLPAPDVDGIAVGDIVLERAGGGWRRPGGAPVDGEAVRSWLDAIGSFRGRVVPLPAERPSLRVTLSAGERKETLLLFGTSGPAVFRRGDEPVALATHPGLRGLLGADATTFADRDVLAFEPTALAGVETSAGEVAFRGATVEEFVLASPAPLPVDAVRLEALRDVASHLRAVRVLALARTPSHGLGRRRIVFTVDPAPGEPEGKRLVLELGSPSPEGGCTAARGGESTVYVISAAACDALSAPLATRKVYELAADEATAATAFGETVERHGGAWYRADGSRLPVADAARLATAIKLLATAPAVAGYGQLVGGTPISFTGPRGTIALRAGHGEYALDGRPVRYRVPEELCRRWEGWCR